MSRLYVGCPMWAHRPWVGRFLPVGTPAGGELAAYSRFVNAVEGNTTFYASPTAATVAKWSEQADPGFRFVFKVPRAVTHERRLRDVDHEIARFVDLLNPVQHLTGALTLQLPASFAPVDLDVLASLLGRLPLGWRWSVEVRHPAFFDGVERQRLERTLAHHEVERVLLDSRTLFSRSPATEAGRDAWAKKPRVPALTEPVTDHPIVRFIGSDLPDVTGQGLAEWEPIVASWLADGRTPTVFVHTPDNLDSPELARSFHGAVGRRVIDLDLLPHSPPHEQAEQGSLF